jgi:uncharacterized DUF497 family protein
MVDLKATLHERITVSSKVAAKLHEKHGVTADEVRQCFANRDGGLLEDDREEHRTDPPTQWFIGQTNKRLKLKVIFIQRQTDSGPRIDIRTAYPPNDREIRIYEKYGNAK